MANEVALLLPSGMSQIPDSHMVISTVRANSLILRHKYLTVGSKIQLLLNEWDIYHILD